MKFDKEKFLQALQEFAWTFGLLFLLSFVAFVTGWTKFPNLNEVKSALTAALLAACVGAAKGLLWFFTGTKVRRKA